MFSLEVCCILLSQGRKGTSAEQMASVLEADREMKRER